jgi:uncharacterized protein
MMTRRTFVKAGTALLPLTALAASAVELAQAAGPQRMPVVTMRYPDLHPSLEGLRILHLSDLHLGADMHVSDLDALLLRAKAARPHLILVTGDVADDHGELAAALALLGKHAPSLGVYASLGNHEYLHDIAKTRPIYERSPIPLLVERGTTLNVGGAKLYLAGANDPVSVDPNISSFMESTVGAAMAQAPKDAFRLLLSHRPDGFVPAAKRGVDLTLSGHTHGMQVGLFGRSAFESMYPERFLWGDYRREKSRLYTTSGFGHWFPFRLNCPTEAPIIVLASGGAKD